MFLSAQFVTLLDDYFLLTCDSYVIFLSLEAALLSGVYNKNDEILPLLTKSPSVCC